MSNFTLYSKTGNDIKKGTRLEDIFPNWKGDKERWLFIAPHDDDIILGGGLLLQKAIEEGVELHMLITTDGQMGYCSPDQKDTIAKIRGEETINSFKMLGIDNVEWLNFPDCDLQNQTGRRKAKEGDPCVFEGYTGLQNAYTKKMRDIDPTRIFLPTGEDLHPDHKTVFQEVQISIFHASGDVWPELGGPTSGLPSVYEMAIYCDFAETPNIKIEATDKELDVKLEGIRAYKSQLQIEMLVQQVKKSGPVEYYRDLVFHLYDPAKYKDLF